MAACARRKRGCEVAVACGWLAWPCWIQTPALQFPLAPQKPQRPQSRHFLTRTCFSSQRLAEGPSQESFEDGLQALRRAVLAEEGVEALLQSLFPQELLDERSILRLLQARERAKQSKEYVLAGLLLSHANPYLEQHGLFVEDIRTDDLRKTYRLVPHPKVVAAGRAAALAEGTKARSIARSALQKSLLADSDDEAAQIAATVTSAVWRQLRSEDAQKWQALPGRQAADLAMVLALAGCTDQSLLDELASIAANEIKRTSRKSALITMQQIVEKCAAAGYRQCDYPELFGASLEALQSLGCPNTSSMIDLRAGNYSLHSERPMLWLFRHATRQGRRSVPPANATAQFTGAIKALNAGRSPSLTVDLGCGFGMSSLGLAVCGFSVLGVDASAHCMGFARSISKRWRLSPQQLSFVHGDAKQALEAVTQAYLGDVQWILVNFPTPFASLDADGPGPGPPEPSCCFCLGMSPVTALMYPGAEEAFASGNSSSALAASSPSLTTLQPRSPAKEHRL